MKLYLSSYYFGDDLDQLKNLIGPNKTRVAIIMNATDIYSDEKRPLYLKKEIEKFKSIGHSADELDLRNYFDNSNLADELARYDMVWVMGGNTFVLRRAMKQSGFDKIIRNLVETDKIIYAGFSAGSIVATKTLKGIDLVDDPNAIPKGYLKEIIWDGLSFVGYSIAPHYKSEHPESAQVNDVVEYFKENQMPFKTLRDGEAIVIKQ